MNKFNDFPNIVQKKCEKDTVFDISTLPDGNFLELRAYNILADNDDNLKPFCIINIKNIENKNQLNLLLSHLINHDGRIREAVSFVLGEIEDKNFVNFFDNQTLNIIVQGLLDINPNVARNLIYFIENSKSLHSALKPLIIQKIEFILDELSVYDKGKFKENALKSTKNHAKNKYTFNLYWLLSSLLVFEIKNNEKIENILTKTSGFLDYTIREKTAQVLSKMENPPLKLLRKLKNDVNIYVKNQLL